MNSSDQLTTDELEAMRLERELSKLLADLTEKAEEWKPSTAAPGAVAAAELMDAASAIADKPSGGSLAQALTTSALGGGPVPATNRVEAPNLAAKLTLGPMWGGLWKLFGDGDEKREPTAVRFEPPRQTLWELGFRPSQDAAPFAVDQDAMGAPRPRIERPTPMERTAPVQVKVEIHALDSRSILDRSDDLADAIRRAMSESHRLSDYLAEE